MWREAVGTDLRGRAPPALVRIVRSVGRFVGPGASMSRLKAEYADRRREAFAAFSLADLEVIREALSVGDPSDRRVNELHSAASIVVAKRKNPNATKRRRPAAEGHKHPLDSTGKDAS
jgi:hypothetical protein